MRKYDRRDFFEKKTKLFATFHHFISTFPTKEELVVEIDKKNNI